MAEEEVKPARKPRAKAVVQDVEVVAEEVKAYTVDELRQLRTDALLAESQAKTELYRMRQRVANMATDVAHETMHGLKAAEERVVAAGEHLKEIESKLAGEVKDIWGTTF